MAGTLTPRPRTSRDVLWDACRAKTCCHTTRVELTGFDLLRLVRAFELDPGQVACHAVIPDGEGFRLSPDGPEHELLLRKNGEIGPAGAPCVFLVETNDGHAACGAGDVRPAVCAAFPATWSDGQLRIAGGACSCRRWSLLDLAPQERDLALTVADEAARHARLVWAWNEGLRASGRPRALADYYRYLLIACA